jgi:hypothetical protein
MFSYRSYPVLLSILSASTGCAAAVGAAVAAKEIRQGFAGVQQLVASSRSLLGAEQELPEDLESPLAGTYRGYQVLGTDTVVFYLRTVAAPTAPIIDDDGDVMGYALPGIAAASLDSLEARVGRGGGDGAGGSAIFFVEGTQAPAANARTLYPAAFLGRVASGESARADSVAAELQALGIEMQAPPPEALAGRGIPHDLFDDVADGVFTLTASGEAVYEQDLTIDDGRELELRFERLSATTLPEPDWLPADRVAPAAQ